jgi:acyl carrier protein
VSVEETIREFVASELSWPGAAAALSDDLPLIPSGAVDSLGLVQLVSFVESAYGIRIGLEEVVPRNFGTIAAIARFVERRRTGSELP